MVINGVGIGISFGNIGVITIPDLESPEPKKYLTIEALEDGLTATFNMTEGNESVEYCIDNGDWVSISSGEETPSINKGQMIAFKGTLTPIIDGENGIYGIGTFSISKECNLKGNCMSLLFGDDAKNHDSLEGFDYAFAGLFMECPIINVESTFLPATTLANSCYAWMFCSCTSLTTAPELPATTLANYCYDSMFDSCTSLTTAPALPTTELAEGCYAFMFCNCTSLTTAPELPATNLAMGCYSAMFADCTSLNYIKMLATDISAEGCLYDWVANVASAGTFIKHPNMTSLPTGVDGIPYGWTVQDAA